MLLNRDFINSLSMVKYPLDSIPHVYFTYSIDIIVRYSCKICSTFGDIGNNSGRALTPCCVW